MSVGHCNAVDHAFQLLAQKQAQVTLPDASIVCPISYQKGTREDPKSGTPTVRTGLLCHFFGRAYRVGTPHCHLLPTGRPPTASAQLAPRQPSQYSSNHRIQQLLTSCVRSSLIESARCFATKPVGRPPAPPAFRAQLSDSRVISTNAHIDI